jgi:hypothetical protein
MITYHYVTQRTPPAPFVMLSLADPNGTTTVRDIPAQVDCAADRTIVPLNVIQAFGLTASRVAEFEGLGGAVVQLSLYQLALAIQPLPPTIVEVAGHPDEPFVLLGRDVINQHRFVLDGPRLVLEIG